MFEVINDFSSRTFPVFVEPPIDSQNPYKELLVAHSLVLVVEKEVDIPNSSHDDETPSVRKRVKLYKAKNLLKDPYANSKLLCWSLSTSDDLIVVWRNEHRQIYVSKKLESYAHLKAPATNRSTLLGYFKARSEFKVISTNFDTYSQHTMMLKLLESIMETDY
ncbi:MAG: hypothetical protein NZO16_02855 [Deltaproteobacteria bacterium]|nr:hypothetical protein [Deltaproteobacteria bacterium]